MRRCEGQAILEYLLILGIAIAALTGVQVYAKRGIQAIVKVGADELGDQREGLVDIDTDLDWKIKGNSRTVTRSGSVQQTTQGAGGAVASGQIERTNTRGVVSESLFVDPNQ